MQVMITGMGAVSAAGNGIEETLESFSAGKRNASDSSFLSVDLVKPVFCASIEKYKKEFSPLIPKGIKEEKLRNTRSIDLCMCAVSEALQMAGFSEDDLSKYRVGVCIGTTVASQLNDISFYRTYKNEGTVPMGAVDRYLRGNIAAAVSRSLLVNGPALTVVNACSSGADAIGTALSWLKTDVCDIVIAGGADELNLVPLAGFSSLGILSESLCVPFDRDRNGLNLGEGAGILILESEKCSEKRGHTLRLCLAGYGASNDAYHLTAPRPDGLGLESAITHALKEANVEMKDVSFVNAHGTGTRDNDRVEGQTLKRFFGDRVKFLSTKGFTGHTLGAAGGLEAVFSSIALQQGWIAGSSGFKNMDKEIGISPVYEKMDISQNYALSTSLAFGGNNAALVIKHI